MAFQPEEEFLILTYPQKSLQFRRFFKSDPGRQCTLCGFIRNAEKNIHFLPLGYSFFAIQQLQLHQSNHRDLLADKLSDTP